MKIIFVTFYDPGAKGVYQLCSVAESCGAETSFISIKNTISKRTTQRSSLPLYYIFDSGIMVGTNSGVDPVTPEEFDITASWINNEKPDYVAISTRSFAMAEAEILAKKIQTPVIAGGWGPTLELDRAKQWASYVCIGEGEKAIQDICSGKKPSQCYPPLTTDELDDLPLPYFKGKKLLISDNKIQSLGYDNKVILASRGCPMTCSYCLSGQGRAMYKEWGYSMPKVRFRSVDSVIKEAKSIKNGKPIRFLDEVMPWKKEWVEEFSKRWKNEVGVPIWGYIRPEFHPRKIIETYKEAGLYRTVLGLQSLNQDILKGVYSRPLKNETNNQFLDTLNNLSLERAYHFISHCHYETEDDLKNKLHWLWKVPYANAVIFPLTVFPGSPLAKKVEAENPPKPDIPLNDWYAWLSSLASANPIGRLVSKVVYRLGLFKKRPKVLWVTMYAIWKIKKLLKP
ncbi:B12-binding domain-containing radical SAM protein [Elusimicrobiota bacterium]